MKSIAAAEGDDFLSADDQPTAQLCFLNCGLQSAVTPKQVVDLVISLVPNVQLLKKQTAATTTTTPTNSNDRSPSWWRQAVHVARSKPYLLMEFATVVDCVQAKAALDQVDEWHGKQVWTAYCTKSELGDPWTDASVVKAAPAPPSSLLPPQLVPVLTVPGLYIWNEFITEAEESQMLVDMDGRPWASLNRRLVQHYGFEFDYSTNAVAVDKPLADPLPAFVQLTVDRITGQLPARLSQPTPDQCTVNRYEPGAGIPPHTDTHSPFGPVIYSLTLGAGTCIAFAGPLRSGVPPVDVYLPRRSLMVMAGDSRYGWTHGIACRQSDLLDGQLVARQTRTSLTLRSVVRDPVACPCQCPFPDRCDSFANGHRRDMGPVEAANVRHVYNVIASHFSETRHSQWPRVKQWLDQRPAGAWIADVGCGNGKYLTGCGPPGSLMFGSDASAGLLVDVCARGRRLRRLVLGSCLQLPYRDCAFDAACCIAVIHHMSSPDRRLAALTELARIVKPGGRILVTVWTKEQKKFKFAESQDLFVDWRTAPSPGAAAAHWKTLPKQSPAQAIPAPGFSSDDISVEKRYYHCFLAGELVGLAKQLQPLVTVVDCYETMDNYVLELEKNAQ